jgi:UDP-N-acetylmuramoylalanine--D-glutamate ligase
MKKDFLSFRIDAATKLLCSSEELQIRGKHNLENALAAVSVAALLGMESDDIEKHLKSFTALEHRLEYVATIDGVAFYNDSKATNTDSTIKALESFPDEKIVLIAGGRDKGTKLDDFVKAAKKYVAAAVLLGEAKERFAEALKAGGFKKIFVVEDLQGAIEKGAELKCGPVVLSPACASFDMFRDYEERGRVFKDLVRARLEKLAPSV